MTSVWPWKLHVVILRRRSRLRLKLSLRRASAAILEPSWPSIPPSRRITTLWRNLQDPKSLLLDRLKRKSGTFAPRALNYFSLSWFGMPTNERMASCSPPLRAQAALGSAPRLRKQRENNSRSKDAAYKGSTSSFKPLQTEPPGPILSPESA